MVTEAVRIQLSSHCDLDFWHQFLEKCAVQCCQVMFHNLNVSHARYIAMHKPGA